MITSSKKPGYQYLRKLMVLPVAAIVTGLFAFHYTATAKMKYDIIIEGNVKHLPDGKVYLAEAHYWNVFLDSTIAKNGHFSFKIKTDSEFTPYMATIAFPDNNSIHKLGGLMFTNEFAMPPGIGNTGFYLEKGLTEIIDNTGKQPYLVPSGATIIPVKIKAGKETEIMYKNFSTEFGWSGGNSAERLHKIASLKKMIKQYPFSYFLLQSIFDERGKYSKEELEDILSHFNKDVQVSKLGDRLKAYLKNGPKSGEQTSMIVDTVKPGTQKFMVIIDGKEQKERMSVNELDKKINLNDIQSITILKDKPAVTKYGEKGKNGVIEIYTKQVGGKPISNEVKPEPLENIEKYDPEELKVESPEVEENIIFEKTEIEPSFPGGETAWKRFLEKNLGPNIPVKNGCPAGTYTVWAKFVVNKDGSLEDFKALTRHGYGMEEEVLKILKSSGNWIPAKQNGHIVKAYKKQAITFFVMTNSQTYTSYYPAIPYLINPSEGELIKIEDLRKVSEIKLSKANSVAEAEIISFLITIDDKTVLKEFINHGSKFSEEIKNRINQITGQTFITIENILVKSDGQTKKINPKIYTVL